MQGSRVLPEASLSKKGPDSRQDDLFIGKVPFVTTVIGRAIADALSAARNGCLLDSMPGLIMRPSLCLAGTGHAFACP